MLLAERAGRGDAVAVETHYAAFKARLVQFFDAMKPQVVDAAIQLVRARLGGDHSVPLAMSSTLWFPPMGVCLYCL